MILEACVGNLKEALNAEKLGASQIELCDRLDLDGTSPPIETIKEVVNQLSIPTKVIINPIPYQYFYATDEIQKILKYIDRLDTLPVQGIVFGPLTKEGQPDLETIRIIDNHTDLPITYHKAIDSSNDIVESTNMLLEQDIVKFILSSGGESTAQKGISQLKIMKSILKDSPIELIGAGKITHTNINQLHHELGLSYYHGKLIVGALD